MSDSRPRTTLVVYAPPTAFAPGAQSALIHLGYNLITPFTAARQRGRSALPPPRLQIVDERLLAQLPADEGPQLPTVLLTDPEGQSTGGPRVAGRVRRRARAEDLYPLLQRALEPQPRGVPRVKDAIPAQWTHEGRKRSGLIRSLSKKGCLLESRSGFEEDQRLELHFPLANRGLVRVTARPAYLSGQSAGFVFCDESELSRASISDYVSSRLSG